MAENHDPLCPLNERCSADHDHHGFCSRQSTFCIHCERECRCEEYARVREDERGKGEWPRWATAEIRRNALRDAVDAVMALYDRHDASCDDPRCEGPDREFAVAAIGALGGER